MEEDESLVIAMMSDFYSDQLMVKIEGVSGSDSGKTLYGLVEEIWLKRVIFREEA